MRILRILEKSPVTTDIPCHWLCYSERPAFLPQRLMASTCRGHASIGVVTEFSTPMLRAMVVSPTRRTVRRRSSGIILESARISPGLPSKVPGRFGNLFNYTTNNETSTVLGSVFLKGIGRVAPGGVAAQAGPLCGYHRRAGRRTATSSGASATQAWHPHLAHPDQRWRRQTHHQRRHPRVQPAGYPEDLGKQFILLVNKGRQGWNCHSLFGVGLFREIFQREEPDSSLEYVIVEVKADNQVEDAVVQAKKDFARQIAVASGWSTASLSCRMLTIGISRNYCKATQEQARMAEGPGPTHQAGPCSGGCMVDPGVTRYPTGSGDGFGNKLHSRSWKDTGTAPCPK